MRFAARYCTLALISALFFPIAPSYGQPTLQAGSAHFTVYQQDKAVGQGDYTIEATPKGYSITSHGKLSLTKFSYSFSNVQALDGSLNLVRDELTGTVNGSAVTFSAASDPTGRQFEINVSANGKQSQNTADRHQHLVLLPDLDPAAYLLLTRVAMANPHTSWVLIPKQDGILVPSSITLGSSARGTLNGSQIDVQHATIAVNSENSINIDLFYSSDGQVLEADLPQQNFSVVRDGFKLLDHPKSAAPSVQPQSSAKPRNAPTQFPAPQGGLPQTQEQ
jgi:hypothetical protein